MTLFTDGGGPVWLWGGGDATEREGKKGRKNGVPTKYERERALFLKTLHEPIFLSIQPLFFFTHLSTFTPSSHFF